MNRALCQSRSCRPEHRGGPRQADAGRPVCRWCADGFAGNVNAIATMWPDLHAQLVSSDQLNEKVSGSRTPGLVINEEVSVTISEVIDWLWFMVRIVLDETSYVSLPSQRSATLLAWLARWHSRRLTHHSDDALVVALIDDAVHYRWLVHRRAYPSRARRVEIPGQCNVVDDETGERCHGALYAIVRTDSSLLPSEIKCDVDDRHVIPSGKWASYGRQLENTKRRSSPK